MNNNAKPSNYQEPNTKHIGYQRRQFKDNRPSIPPKEQLKLLSTLFINNNAISA